jgi:hypothetical protein
MRKNFIFAICALMPMSIVQDALSMHSAYVPPNLRDGTRGRTAAAPQRLEEDNKDALFNQLSEMRYDHATIIESEINRIVGALINCESPDVRLRVGACCLGLLPFIDPESESYALLIGVLQGMLRLFESSRNLVTQFYLLMGVLDCQMGMQVIPVPEFRVCATPGFIEGFLERVLINKLLDSYPEIGRAMCFMSRLWICLNKFGVFKSYYKRFNGLYGNSVDVLLDAFQRFRLRKDADALAALVNFAKVHGHGHREKQIACVEVALRALGGRDFSVPSFLSVARRGKIGLDALFTYARIPGDPKRQINCAEAIIRARGKIYDLGIDVFTLDILLSVAQRGKSGVDALFTYAQIPGNPERRLVCVETCAIAKFGDDFYPGQVESYDVLRTCFLNIVGPNSLRPVFAEKSFRNGKLISDFRSALLELLGTEPPEDSETSEDSE